MLTYIKQFLSGRRQPLTTDSKPMDPLPHEDLGSVWGGGTDGPGTGPGDPSPPTHMK